MSAVLSHPASAATDVAARLAFQKQLQAVTNKIHATNNIDEIMLEVSADVRLRSCVRAENCAHRLPPIIGALARLLARPLM